MVVGEREEDVRDRPYVEILRVALAGYPVPEALVGEPTLSAGAGGDLASFEAETARAWVAVHASAYQQLGPLLAKLIPRLERAESIAPEEVHESGLVRLWWATWSTSRVDGGFRD